ncbi:MAG: Gfo/Idh/MocA family oxidoreductase [Lentisphaeria bacterium]|nr:Gfo/Idh/MocA family oxidoreductase [Lentisphaeria bacterium]
MKRIKIIQIGMFHEHAIGKIEVLKNRTDLFELVGYVDEREFCTTPRLPNPNKPEFYRDIPKLTIGQALNFPGLEAVAVEVPNNDLVQIATRCMVRNLAIHMDKPAGPDLERYRKLLEGCRERKLPFQIGYMFRGNPAFKFCLDAVRDKLIGDVFEITADMNHCYGGELYQEYIAKFPGGLAYNLSCHLIDFVAAALGRPENVTSFLNSAPGYPDEVKNNCLTVLTYPHALAVIRSCSKDAGGTAGRAMKIAGTKGTIKFSPLERFDGKSLELELDLAEDSGDFSKGVHTVTFPPQTNRYDVQMLELAEMIRNGAQSSYSAEHDLLVHEIVLAASGLIPWRREENHQKM